MLIAIYNMIGSTKILAMFEKQIFNPLKTNGLKKLIIIEIIIRINNIKEIIFLFFLLSRSSKLIAIKYKLALESLEC